MAASLQYRLTTNNLGGAATENELSATALNNLFDNVSPAEAGAGDVEYRALDIYNNGDATAVAVSFYASETLSTGTSLQFGLGASPINSTTSIVNESTAPAGVSFASYTESGQLEIPDIPAASYARLWIKRIVAASTPNMANDGSTLYTTYA